MARKPPPPKKRPPDNPEQYKRFLETAKEVEASDDSEALETGLRRIAKSPKPKEAGG